VTVQTWLLAHLEWLSAAADLSDAAEIASMVARGRALPKWQLLLLLPPLLLLLLLLLLLQLQTVLLLLLSRTHWLLHTGGVREDLSNKLQLCQPGWLAGWCRAELLELSKRACMVTTQITTFRSLRMQTHLLNRF
jgi:hypothetical protein